MSVVKPLVSIWCPTYNQEKYIGQAIESFLSQKTTFGYQIIIHDDASTDNTPKIIGEYSIKYPHLIKPIFQSVNQLSQNMGSLAEIMIREIHTKYISICEGDDYWTDPLKLQKQVDFLENNPDFNICFHPVNVLTKDGIKDDWMTNSPKNDVSTILDLVSIGNYIHTPSIVFRNVLREYPREYSYSPIPDYFIYLLLTRNGEKIKELNDKMAIYRLGVGIYSGDTRINRQWAGIYSLYILSSYFNEYRSVFKDKLFKAQDAIVNDIKRITLQPAELASNYGIKKLTIAFFIQLYKKFLSLLDSLKSH